ncbi:uncharacterized protein LOC144168413 [Haemaphysalis longicornis]
MQMFIFLVLLALTTTLDATLVQEAGGVEGDKLQKGFEPTALKGMGQKIESLGKLLQGDVSLSTPEERESTMEAIKALKMFQEEPEEGSEEYFIMLIAQAIIAGVLIGGASAGIKYGVESLQNGK